MKFEMLQQRVERAERLVELRAEQSVCEWESLKQTWRTGWTPARIIAAGLAAGFLVGRANPMRALSGTRWMPLVSSISSLFASVKAAMAAGQAGEAADTAVETADEAAAHTQQASFDDMEEPMVDEAFYDEDEDGDPIAPRPAEAATEVSER
ncbi:protein sip-5 [Pseudoxanthomonas sp. UTMC 1351]|uniref:protein sip-5 n=1 Tax=Pseudoxanthomonas sp. UTMC 1351 TaxID=2695853 RepID=UPI0034CF7200